MYGGYEDDDVIVGQSSKSAWNTGAAANLDGKDDLAGNLEEWKPKQSSKKEKEVSFMIDDNVKFETKKTLFTGADEAADQLFVTDNEEDDLGPPTPPPEPEQPINTIVESDEEEKRIKSERRRKEEKRKIRIAKQEARDKENKKLRETCEKLIDRIKDTNTKFQDLKHKNDDKEKKLEQLQKHLLLGNTIIHDN
jgi:septin family protein